MDFVGKRHLWFKISGIILILGLGFLIFSGLNLGVDFTGGTLVTLAFDDIPSVPEVGDVLAGEELKHLDLEGSFIQRSEDNILIRSRELSDDEISQVFSALEGELGSFRDLDIERVGPVIGQELFRDAILALLLASVLIVGYVSVRFEFRSGVTAIITLLHDVFIVLGIFAILGWQLNSSFIAAILTVVGYSINDTIVLFDRIRENRRLKKSMALEDSVNLSISQTIVRSLNTSVTTFAVVGALFIFGAPVIREFSFALLLGILVGTYSSIFIASPLWVEWNLRAKKARA